MATKIAVMDKRRHPAGRHARRDLRHARQPVRRRFRRLAGDEHARVRHRQGGNGGVAVIASTTASTFDLADYRLAQAAGGRAAGEGRLPRRAFPPMQRRSAVDGGALSFDLPVQLSSRRPAPTRPPSCRCRRADRGARRRSPGRRSYRGAADRCRSLLPLSKINVFDAADRASNVNVRQELNAREEIGCAGLRTLGLAAGRLAAAASPRRRADELSRLSQLVDAARDRRR